MSPGHAQATVPGSESIIAPSVAAPASRLNARTFAQGQMGDLVSSLPIAGASACAAGITRSSTAWARGDLTLSMISTLKRLQRNLLDARHLGGSSASIKKQGGS